MHQEMRWRYYILIQEMQQSNVSTFITHFLSRNPMFVRQVTEYFTAKKGRLRVHLSKTQISKTKWYFAFSGESTSDNILHHVNVK